MDTELQPLIVSPSASRWNGAMTCIVIFILGCVALSTSVGITATLAEKSSTVDPCTTTQKPPGTTFTTPPPTSTAPPPTSTAPPPTSTAPPPTSTAPPPTSTAPPPTSTTPPPTSTALPPTSTVTEPLPVSAPSTLNVLSLSVWGSPGSFGTEDKELRIDAIAKFIQNNTKYDVFLLNELWMRPDHAKIKSLLPEGYHMSLVGDFSLSSCDGTIAPEFCSGLAAISRHPVVEKQFTSFSTHGDFFWDYEYFLRRGVGRMRISPGPDCIVDIFVTSLASLQYNHWYREKQAEQLMEVLEKSDADFMIVGGDFNVDPLDNEKTYELIKSELKDSVEEFYKHDKTKWSDPRLATFGNKMNSYSSSEHPVTYDYLWYKAKGGGVISVKDYQVPILKTSGGNKVSFSDHEAIMAEFTLSKG